MPRDTVSEMPSKFIVRNFTEGGVYYIYNKGIENRTIFEDDKDYEVFLYYLFIYTKPLKVVLQKHINLPSRLRKKNISTEVDLICFCLLPNSFHLILQQHTKRGISKLMKQLMNAYTIYFNKKHSRVGSLMQGRFKASKIDVENHLIQMSRYIHRQPINANITHSLSDYRYSSLREYVKDTQDPLCKKRILESFFENPTQYEEFVFDEESYAKDLSSISHILIS